MSLRSNCVVSSRLETSVKNLLPREPFHRKWTEGIYILGLDEQWRCDLWCVNNSTSNVSRKCKKYIGWENTFQKFSWNWTSNTSINCWGRYILTEVFPTIISKFINSHWTSTHSAIETKWYLYVSKVG